MAGLLCPSLVKTAISFSLPISNALTSPQLVDAGFDALAIDEIASQKASFNLSPELAKDIPIIRSHAIRIPYLRFKETDYIYRFRTEKQR